MPTHLQGILRAAEQGASLPPKPPTPDRKRSRAVESPQTPSQTGVASVDSSRQKPAKRITLAEYTRRRNGGGSTSHPSPHGFTDRKIHPDYGDSTHSRSTTPNNNHPPPQPPMNNEAARAQHPQPPMNNEASGTQHQQPHNRRAPWPLDPSDPNMATPFENPKRSSTFGSPATDDWRPQSPKMDDLPAAKPIPHILIARKRVNRHGTKLGPYYWIRKDNVVTVHPNTASKQNRYGPQLVIDPVALETKFIQVENRARHGPVKATLNRSSYEPMKLTQTATIIEEKIIAQEQQKQKMEEEKKQKEENEEKQKYQKELDRKTHELLLRTHQKKQQEFIRKEREKENEEQRRRDMQAGNSRKNRRHENEPLPNRKHQNSYLQRPRHPFREMFPEKYRLWSKKDLQDEAGVRHLQLDDDTKEYLVEVLKVDDDACHKSYYVLKNRCATLGQLRDEARKIHMHLDYRRSYDYYELLRKIADMYGRDAVDDYNKDLRRCRAKESQSAKERAAETHKPNSALMREASLLRSKTNSPAGSGYSTGQQKSPVSTPITASSPESSSKLKQETKSKGTKRHRAAQDTGDDEAPSKKRMSSSSKPPSASKATSASKALSASSPEFRSNWGQNTKSKGTKRQRAAHDTGDDEVPSKKRKPLTEETSARAIKTPRSVLNRARAGRPVIFDDADINVEMSDFSDSVAVEALKHKAATTKPKKATATASQKASTRSQTTKRAGVAVKVTKKAKKEVESSSEECDEDSEDNWLVEDEDEHKPKRKSQVGKMAASRLIKGMT